MKNITTFFFLFIFSLSYSQRINKEDVSDDQNKLLFSVHTGFSTGILPVKAYDNSNDRIAQMNTINLLIGTGARFNIFEPGQNLAIGLDIDPALNIGLTESHNFTADPTSQFPELDDPEGYCGFNIPIGVSLNIGAGSTYECLMDRGVVLKGGVEYLYTPIKGSNFESTSKSYISPFAQISYRSYSEKYTVVSEYFIRYNFMKNDPIIQNLTHENIDNPIFISAGLSGLINYNY